MNSSRLAEHRFTPLLLAVFCLAMHTVGSWNLSLMDRDEPRFAEASREMRERGDYVVPYFNHEMRLDKPPLVYWAQTVCYSVFGENEFAARLPSAIAATLTALVVFGFGSRLYDRRAGLWAAIIFTLSADVLIHARMAVADLCMVFFVALASWAGWELREGQARRAGWWLVFYVALAFGFLAKGPVALLPIGTVLLYPGNAGKNRLMKFHLGLPMMIAIIALWGIPALMETRGEFFRVGIGKHVVARSFTALEGHGARGLVSYFVLLPFYFVTIFGSFFPWSIYLPALIARFWSKENRGMAERYLLGGIILTFAVFTPLGTKLPHYTLPAVPLLAILCAGQLRRGRTPFLLAGGMCAVVLACCFILAPTYGHLLPVSRIAAACAPFATPQMEVAAVDFDEPSLVWYFRAWTRRWVQRLGPDEIVAFMKQPGPRCCVMPEKIARQTVCDPAWTVATANGFNLPTGKAVQLVLWGKAK